MSPLLTLQVQTTELLSRLQDIFLLNRKIIMFNGLMIVFVFITGLRNYRNTQTTRRMAQRGLDLLEKMNLRRAALKAAELAQARNRLR